MKIINGVVAAVLMMSLPVFPGKLTGEISFEARVPFVGIVYIPGSADNAQASIDQKGKKFDHKLYLIPSDKTVKFLNSDNMDHNIYANDRKTGVAFDIGLIEAGEVIEQNIKLPKDTFIRLGCKIHPKMRTYVSNIKTSHYQIIEFKKGTQTYKIDIDGVDSKKQMVKLWMPKYSEMDISVAPGKAVRTDIIKKDKVVGSIRLSI